MQNVGLVEIAGILIVIGYIVWVIVFFQVVRPWLMNRLGSWIGVRVRESLNVLDAGTYTPKGSASLGQHTAVSFLDLIVLLLGVVGVCAMISIPGFLIADSGAPYRWEGILTQSQVRIEHIAIVPMSTGETTASITVNNAGKQPAENCRLSVADYKASNGYLTGASDYFNLNPGEVRVEAMSFSAFDPPPGTYNFRLSLDCENRLKDRVGTSIEVIE